MLRELGLRQLRVRDHGEVARLELLRDDERLVIEYRDQMAAVMPVASWFVISALLAPAGYVIQDAVAEAKQRNADLLAAALDGPVVQPG